MSLQAVIARIAQIDEIVSPRPQAASTPTTGTSGFLTALDGVQHSSALAAPAAAPQLGAGTAGQRAIAAAQAEVGVTEQPPGSNDSPRIAQYRQATAGSGVGPWCAYFASWAARQAGVPLGDQGQGFGAVSDVWAWAQRSGKAIQPGSQTPQPGDLIVWGGRHIGIVESVDADGSIHTIEGNSSNAVSRRTYGPDGGGATGYVH